MDVNLFLLGSAFGILMYQRDIYCLHGSAFHTKNSKSVIVVGDSGAGKSSFMAGMSERSYKIMTDDVTRIIENDGVYASSSYPTQKIWRNIAEQFNISLINGQELTYRNDKFVIEDKNNFINTIAMITMIIELKVYNGDRVYIDKLENADALSTIINHTYRPEYIESSGDRVKHFLTMTNIAKNVKVYRLYRPIKGVTVSEQNNIVISQLLKDEAL